MTVTKLTKKDSPKKKEEDALSQAFIMRGGKTTEESKVLCDDEEVGADKETRFTIRIPDEMVEEIDANRKKSAGKISRNTWILEAIARRLETQKNTRTTSKWC